MKKVKYIRRSNNRGKHRRNVTRGRKLNKKKVVMVLAIFCLIIASIVKLIKGDETTVVETAGNEIKTSTQKEVEIAPVENEIPKKEIDDWKITLANIDNPLPENFTVELANIDDHRQFDARAIEYLKDMLNDMRKDGATDVWVQSAYRSVETQKNLYENSINKYLKQGKTQEEAERLTLEYINKPGTSEHNLGLAVDFNEVTDEFAKTKAFKWLNEHAQDYGFILRYPKEKEEITKIEYESWHWRYVGEEHAKKINELNMCLEEYIEYLENN